MDRSCLSNRAMAMQRSEENVIQEWPEEEEEDYNGCGVDDRYDK